MFQSEASRETQKSKSSGERLFFLFDDIQEHSNS